MKGLLEDAMRRIESGVYSDADAKLAVKWLRWFTEDRERLMRELANEPTGLSKRGNP